MVNQTLIAVHTCMPLTLLIVALRITLRARRPLSPKRGSHRLDASDILCILSIPFLIARWALVQIVVTWGTNNVSAGKKGFAPGEIWRREVGSKCVLGSRVTFASFVWAQKAVLLLFYHRLIYHTSWGRPILKAAWFALFASYVAVQATTFTECHPFRKYYEVSLHPGMLSIFTDLMLILIPIPVLSKIKQPFRQKAQLAFLFSLGIFVTLVTAIRIPENFKNSTKQVDRTTWVSIEILVASFVANTPTIYGLLRQRHIRKGEHSNWTGHESRSTATDNHMSEIVVPPKKHRQHSESSSSGDPNSDGEANLSMDEIRPHNSRPFGWPSGTPHTYASV